MSLKCWPVVTLLEAAVRVLQLMTMMLLPVAALLLFQPVLSIIYSALLQVTFSSVGAPT